MPPNRRRKVKKNDSIDAKHVADDDLFETDDKPVKKTLKRFKASNAARQKLRSNSKSSLNNHVDMKQKVSSSPEMGNKSPTTVGNDSEQVNLHLCFV